MHRLTQLVALQITLETRDIFIECTATDLAKAKVVLATLCTMFSQYCTKPFEVEPVEVIDAFGVSKGEPESHGLTALPFMRLSTAQEGIGWQQAGSSGPETVRLPAVYPTLEGQQRTVDAAYIEGCLGLNLGPGKIAELLSRMALDAAPTADGKAVTVVVPPTRSDVLHDADVMEAITHVISIQLWLEPSAHHHRSHNCC